MEITKVMVEKDDPEKGQRLATVAVVLDGAIFASGFSVFPDRHRQGKLRVLFPARRAEGEMVEIFSILDPAARVELITAVISACEAEGIKAEGGS